MQRPKELHNFSQRKSLMGENTMYIVP